MEEAPKNNCLWIGDIDIRKFTTVLLLYSLLSFKLTSLQEVEVSFAKQARPKGEGELRPATISATINATLESPGRSGGGCLVGKSLRAANGRHNPTHVE